jgi:hypothetical protein
MEAIGLSGGDAAKVSRKYDNPPMSLRQIARKQALA